MILLESQVRRSCSLPLLEHMEVIVTAPADVEVRKTLLSGVLPRGAWVLVLPVV